ncbi:MAG TPA: tetratricopeptide repeat protein, partial [bacterium]|nr:tetratricopeptide repeat protein [bacterium]
TDVPPKKNKAWGSIIAAIVVVGFGIYGNLDSNNIDKNNDAVANMNSGNTEMAIEQLTEAKNSMMDKDNKINTLKNLAYAYYTEGEIDSALQAFNEALALCDKNSFDYYLIAGEIDLLLYDPAGALENFTQAEIINPDDYQLNNTLALFYIDVDEIAPAYVDYQKGLSYAQKAYELDQSEITKQNLAMAYFFTDNFDKTIELLESSDISKHPYAAFWIGLAYAGKEDPAKAIIYFQKALDNGADLPQEILDYMAGN